MKLTSSEFDEENESEKEQCSPPSQVVRELRESNSTHEKPEEYSLAKRPTEVCFCPAFIEKPTSERDESRENKCCDEAPD